MLPGVVGFAPVAQAQFSEGYNFLKAVRDADGAKVMELVDRPGSTLIDSRDISTGETALMIVVARRDLSWLNFLLSKGAKPDLGDRAGNTPLIAATQLRFADGVRALLTKGASVDKPNGSGETALIRAVQLRDVSLIRILVDAGANPDKRDTLAGLSARDYAQRDGRAGPIMDALAKAKPGSATKAPVQGPVF
ncbi:ankyrin repeat domain-containing protein [Sphingobium subterraneum]|nr:ankyrin repeat domain-containing protein [Sphingobium subterraneum]